MVIYHLNDTSRQNAWYPHNMTLMCLVRMRRLTKLSRHEDVYNGSYDAKWFMKSLMSRISSLQIKIARTALGWSVDQLSEATQISRSTLKRVETEDGFKRATQANLKLIKQTLEAQGIEFIGTEEEGPGIRLWHNKS